MRKIDKTEILSTEYKDWLEKLNRDKLNHPHSRTYYRDVAMNLLRCQKGVCAYTEIFLCNPDLLTSDKWENGRYKTDKPETLGELEHFDPALKEEKYWAWDNLFFVESTINRRKGAKEVDDILKPDSPEYDPTALLEYDEELHIFLPNQEIKDKTKKDRIQRMIDVLRLNFDAIRRQRKRFLKNVFEFQDLELPIEIDRFFTAYEMAAGARTEEQSTKNP